MALQALQWAVTCFRELEVVKLLLFVDFSEALAGVKFVVEAAALAAELALALAVIQLALVQEPVLAVY